MLCILSAHLIVYYSLLLKDCLTGNTSPGLKSRRFYMRISQPAQNVILGFPETGMTDRASPQ